MKHTQCEKHELLRTVGGHTVVSSAALHDYLGGTRYQEFIRWNGATKGSGHRALRLQVHKNLPGFHPATVEEFLREV